MQNHTRRTLLKAIPGISITGFVCSAESISKCPLSFGTYGLPGYTLSDAIRLVSETGYDSIEFASMPGYHGAPDKVSKAQRTEIRKLLADTNLKLGALMGLPTPNEKKQSDNTGWVKQVLELANDLSPETPPIIQSVLGGGEWATKKDLFRDCLGPWVNLAFDAGVKLAIKPHRGHAMSLPEEAVWLIDQLNATGKLGLVYDQSHYAYRELPIIETVASALPHTSYLVMKDAVQQDGKVRFELPGETDTIPHAEILKQFIDGGYQGEVCAEVSSQVWKREGYDAAEAVKTCFSNLTTIAAKAAE